MRIILSFVSSINGKITLKNNPNPSVWSSEEDKQFYHSLLRKADYVITSLPTLKAMSKETMRKCKRIIVITRKQVKLKEKNVAISNLPPKKIIQHLKTKKPKLVLLSVGSQLATIFVKDNLVDELYITFEPIIIGEGKNMFAEANFLRRFHLCCIKKLNSEGTVLLHYKRFSSKTE